MDTLMIGGAKAPVAKAAPTSVLNLAGSSGSADATVNKPLTSDIAKDLMTRAMSGGATTAEFNPYGGYAAVKNAYVAGGGDFTGDTTNVTPDGTVLKPEALKVEGNVVDTGPYQNVPAAAPAYTPIVNPYAGKTPAELAALAAGGIKQATTSTYTPTDQKTADYTAGGYDTTTWDIDPEDIAKGQTVQGQLQGIIAANSPLIQLAEAQARQQMNQRGLLNTSMALGAGQEAVIKQALPIATQDATLFANQAKYNAEAASAAAQFKAAAENRASEFNASAKNTAFAANKAASDAALQFEAAAKNASSANYTKDLNTAVSQMMDQSLKVGLADADNKTKLLVQQIDADTRKYLIDTEATYKNQMQASSSANDLYVNITKNIATIMADPNLDATAKQAAVNIQKDYLKSGLDIIGQTSGVGGIDELVDFSGEEGEEEATGVVKPKPLTSGANFQTIAKQYGNQLITDGGTTVDTAGVTTFNYKNPITNKTATFNLPAGSYFDEEENQIVNAAGAIVPIPSGLIAGELTKEKIDLLSPKIQPGDAMFELESTFAGTGINLTGATINSKGVTLKNGTVIPLNAEVENGKIYKANGTLLEIKPKDKI